MNLFANVGGWCKPAFGDSPIGDGPNFWPIFTPPVAIGGFTPAVNVSKRFNCSESCCKGRFRKPVFPKPPLTHFTCVWFLCVWGGPP